MKRNLFRTSLLVAAISSVGLMIANDAMALPSQSHFFQYYSDDTFSQQVGYENLACNGTHSSGGQVTDFYKYEWSNCDPNCDRDDICPDDPFGPGGTEIW